MANLYLFKYNNYHNKLLKVQQTIDGYGEPLSITQSTNFNPNDGITTQHIVNTDFTVIPDYCVVMSDYGEIESRWFVMSCKRIRKGQWRVELLRDSLAEYRSQVLDAVCFVEKGYVNNANPLVFNNENMGFNQIKSGEYLLENKLKSPWVVLYLSRYHTEENSDELQFNEFKGRFYNNPSIVDTTYSFEKWNEYTYNQWFSLSYYTYILDEDLIFLAEYRTDDDPYTVKCAEIGYNYFNSTTQKYGYPRIYTGFDKNIPILPAGFEFNLDASMEWGVMAGEYSQGKEMRGNIPVNSYFPVRINNSDHYYVGYESGYNTLKGEAGKTIEVKEWDTIYQFQMDYDENYLGKFVKGAINETSSLGDLMKSIFFRNVELSSSAELNLFVIGILSKPYLHPRRHAVNLPNQVGISYSITYDTAITRDAPYEIIAAPLYNITFTDGTEEIYHQGEIILQMFQQIMQKYYEAGFAYDLQIVPYVPIDDFNINEKNYEIIKAANTTYGVYFKLDQSTFSLNVKVNNIPLRNDYKLSNELDLYRLVSPNGVGEYEFSPSKNGGSINKFEIDCSLIPFNPYIKINPSFTGLYGADYDDYRGLICGGDYSLPIVSNAWETYQLQNKYYQDIFNRQISHQEYNNKFALASDIIGATTGAVSAGVEGLRLGGGVGGAAVGAGLGVIAGTADVVTNQMLRNEEIRYQKDQYGFQLGTIKARADSLTRTTSFNQNNKYFPYIEYYTCTPVEEEALKKKMEYNGMTVGVIGKISDYLSPTYEYTYVQAELIEIDIPDDYQMVEEIARRLRGGIRIA